MKKLLIMMLAVIGCICLVGCENTSQVVPVKVEGCGEYVEFIWEDKTSVVSSNNQKKLNTITLSVGNMSKLSRFVYTLEECSGYYQLEGWKYLGDGKKEKYIETMKCRETLPVYLMTQEYDNGYICDRCKQFRQEELRKKIESLEK